MRRPRALAPILSFVVLTGCVVEVPDRKAADAFEKPISFSILEDYDKGEDLKEVEADFRLFKELGIHAWRGSFGWDDYEPARGQYDFEWLHRFAELAGRYGITLRPYIGYTPEWAAKAGGKDQLVWNNPPANLGDWRQFVFRLASAMGRHRHVLSYEMYNEENSPLWWDGSLGEYTQVLRAGSDAVRAAHADDQVLMGGLTYPDVAWTGAACAGLDDPGAVDVIPLHAYPETWPDDVMVEDYFDQGSPGSFAASFLPEADRECGRKPIWINETGFATTPGKRTERDQANWWARAIATFAAQRRVEHIGIYEFKDRPRSADVIGEPENYYLGLTYPDRRKKLAFFTVKLLVGLLNTGKLVVADDAAPVEVKAGTPGRVIHHLFILPDGRQLAFLWSRTGSPVVRLGLPHPGRSAVEYGLDGSVLPFSGFNGRTLNDVRLAAGEVRVFEIRP